MKKNESTCLGDGFYLEGGIGGLEFVALLHAFAAAVLGVAAVLQRAPLLLQTHHFLAREAVQLLCDRFIVTIFGIFFLPKNSVDSVLCFLARPHKQQTNQFHFLNAPIFLL